MADLVFPSSSSIPTFDVSASGYVSMPTTSATVIHSKSFSAGTYLVDANMTFVFGTSSTSIPGSSGLWRSAISLTTGYDTADNADLSVALMEQITLNNLFTSTYANIEMFRMHLKRQITLSSTQTIYIVANYPGALTNPIRGLAQMMVTKF